MTLSLGAFEWKVFQICVTHTRLLARDGIEKTDIKFFSGVLTLLLYKFQK